MKKESNPVWIGRIHEYNKINGKTINCDEVDFHHYRDEGKGTQNTARNLRILKKVVDDCTPEERPRHLFYYGKELTYNKMYDEAIKAFEEYIPLSNWIPEKQRALYELAVCYQIKGDITKAKKYALEAINVDEDFVDSYVLLGKIAYNNKEWKQVIKWMTAATLTQTPKVQFFDFVPYATYVPYDFMAIAYWNLGDYEKGKKCVEKCLEYKPKDGRYINNLKEFEKVII
jgi:tetratricopeptide (TPR) repeat protein